MIQYSIFLINIYIFVFFMSLKVFTRLGWLEAFVKFLYC